METETSPLAHRGQFEIDRETLETNLDAVFAVMQTVIVTRAEFIYSRGVFLYEAICPSFEAVDEGAENPMYEAELDQDDSGYKVTWAKAA